MTSLRTQALIAEELSALLLETYQNKQVQQMVADFAKVGFTKNALLHSPNQIYLMVVTASYDRRPFTGVAGGYEYIWGMKEQERSVPSRLIQRGLSDKARVLKCSLEEISILLKQEKYKEYELNRFESVDYAKTLINIATVTEELHDMLVHTTSSKDANCVYNELTKIHGIGETIAAKLIKYMLREIGIGKIDTSSFPLSVAWPLVAEYHNEQAIEKVNKLGKNIVPLAMGLLLKKGDPFAIDALFYLNRYEPKKIEDFVSDLRQWDSSAKRINNQPEEVKPTSPSMDKAKHLMSIIKEVCDDVNGITKNDLQGLVSPQKVTAAAAKLYREMLAHALKGDINGMYQYYKNCLSAESGMTWDWLLERIGRKSLRSEWERFNAIYNELDS